MKKSKIIILLLVVLDIAIIIYRTASIFNTADGKAYVDELKNKSGIEAYVEYDDNKSDIIEYVDEVKNNYSTEFKMPDECMGLDLSAKTYMCYRKITDKTSRQYEYIYNSGEITVNDNGFLVTDDRYIGVAMGSYFGDIGSKYIMYLDNGKIIKVVKVEAKADDDTCNNGFMGAVNNDVIEFVVDSQSPYMQRRKRSNGLIYGGNFNNYYEFNGNIISIRKVIQ